MFYPRPVHLHRVANSWAWATSQGDTSSPHSHAAHEQPTLSHHISADITNSPIIFLCPDQIPTPSKDISKIFTTAY